MRIQLTTLSMCVVPVSYTHLFSDLFLAKHKDNLVWDIISENSNALTDTQINVYSEYVNWKALCANYTLKEITMLRFADKLSWDDVSRHQRLTATFLQDYKDKINWHHVLNNNTKIKISHEDINNVLHNST